MLSAIYLPICVSLLKQLLVVRHVDFGRHLWCINNDQFNALMLWHRCICSNTTAHTAATRAMWLMTERSSSSMVVQLPFISGTSLIHSCAADKTFRHSPTNVYVSQIYYNNDYQTHSQTPPQTLKGPLFPLTVCTLTGVIVVVVSGMQL